MTFEGGTIYLRGRVHVLIATMRNLFDFALDSSEYGKEGRRIAHGIAFVAILNQIWGWVEEYIAVSTNINSICVADWYKFDTETM